MLAMLGCLLAASQLHAHEAGLHDVDHACISCDLEDIVSHGAVPVSTFALKTDVQSSDVVFYRSYTFTPAFSFSSIRAPPLHF